MLRALIMFAEEYRLWSSSLSSFLEPRIICSLLGSPLRMWPVSQAVLTFRIAMHSASMCLESQDFTHPRSKARAIINSVTWSIMSSLIQIKFKDHHPDVHRCTILHITKSAPGSHRLWMRWVRALQIRTMVWMSTGMQLEFWYCHVPLRSHHSKTS